MIMAVAAMVSAIICCCAVGTGPKSSIRARAARARFVPGFIRRLPPNRRAPDQIERRAHRTMHKAVN
jgi:hypothetical protein